MSFEIPSVRVRELQSALRLAAGVPSYDPDDPSLPPLPSLADAIATLHPETPASLRCGRCSAPLLRGLQSTLCIYCGVDRKDEAVAQSISFNSTSACRKLLDFLGLDGSETVVLETEPTGSSKSQAKPKDELALSELLDLELIWPSNKEVESSDSFSGMSTSAVYPLNLKGLDFDAFFNQLKKEAASTAPSIPSEVNEQVKQKNHSIDTIERRLSRSESFAEFEELQTSNTRTVAFVNDNQGDSLTTWEAEFQFASSENFTSDESQDIYKNSSAKVVQDKRSPNFDIQAEEMVPKANASEFTNEPSLSSFSNNWVPDEILDGNIVKAVNMSTANELKLESDSMREDHWIDNNVNCLGSESKDSNTSANMNLNNDLFDVWKDFAKSEPQGNASSLKAQTENLFENNLEIHATEIRPISSTSVVENNDFASGSNESLDGWNDFAKSEPQGDASNLKAHTENLFENNLEIHATEIRPISSTSLVENNDFASGSNNSLDGWNDFASFERPASLTSMQPQSEAASFEHPLEANSVYLLPIGKVNSDTSLNSNGNADLFDAWHDFANSSEARGNQLNQEAPIEASLFDYLSDAKTAKTVDFWPSSSQKESEKNKSFKDNDVSDDWQDFTSFSGQLSSFSSTSAALPKHPLETNSVDFWSSSSQREPEKHISVTSNDESDDWQYFTSFSGGQDNSFSLNSALPEHPLQSNSGHQWPAKVETKYANVHDDSLDDLLDFASSVKATGSIFVSQHKSEPMLFENVSEIKSVCLEDSMLSINKTLFDAPESQKDASNGKDNKHDASASDRMIGIMDLHFGEWQAKIADENPDASKKYTESSVEKLRSQIPDLSFMLADELSIPKKLDISKTSSSLDLSHLS